MTLGIQLSSFRPYMKDLSGLRHTCRNIAEMGCLVIQAQWMDPSIAPQEAARVFQDFGLSSVSVQDYSQEVIDHLAYYVTLNRLTGGRYVTVSRIPAAYHSLEGMHRWVLALRGLAAQLAEQDQQLLFHPVLADYGLIEGVSPVDFLLEQCPSLQLCLDLYHLYKAGHAFSEWIPPRAPRIVMMHCKDEREGHLVPAGQGVIPLAEAMRICPSAAYAFVEQETWDGDAFACLQEAYAWGTRIMQA